MLKLALGLYVIVIDTVGGTSSRAKKIGPQSGRGIARLGARIPPYVADSDTCLSSTTQILLLIPLLFLCCPCYVNLNNPSYSLALKLHKVGLALKLAGRCCGGPIFSRLILTPTMTSHSPLSAKILLTPTLNQDGLLCHLYRPGSPHWYLTLGLAAC
jgi:hypothetical protein